jgi:SAM-dependent methyltransferase
MVLGVSEGDRRASGEAAQPSCEQAHVIVWHDLECGSYTADLALWRELVDRAGTGAGAQPLLDVGAGTGRVALDLTTRGHLVVALDRDASLLSALRERAGEMAIETVCADARVFDLSRHDFAVCLVPMQTIQLLGGAAGRGAFLRRARAHLRRGGLLACAIVTDIEPFDCARGDAGPEAEIALVSGTRYVSRATCLKLDGQTLRIERERSIHEPGAPPRSERDVVRLECVSARQLHAEGVQAGLVPAGTLEIPATEEHVGSEVVLLHA